jgi:nucleoside-diphosphate-sugar epimerase
MKILITGGTGFVGKNLIEYYRNNHTIIETKRGDHIPTVCERQRPDLIINSAAEIYNKETMFDSNVELTRMFLEYVKSNPSARMIQIGSSAEYGDVNRATTEADTIKPYDMYSATKGMATLLCQGYARSYNLDVVIVRPYSPYGPGEKPHRLFPNLWRAFKLGRPMDLVMGVHDFCYIDDFVEALDLILNSDKRIPGEIINISSGVQTGNAEVLSTFRSITGLQGDINVKNIFSTWPHWQADISHVKNKYGWKPRFSLEQGIRKFLEIAKYE